MALKRPLEIAVPDQATQRAIDATNVALNGVIDSAIVDGVAVRGVTITAGTVAKAPHGLGRRWRGWIVTDQTAFAHVKRSASNDTDERTVALEADADVTVDLWIF